MEGEPIMVATTADTAVEGTALVVAVGATRVEKEDTVITTETAPTPMPHTPTVVDRPLSVLYRCRKTRTNTTNQNRLRRYPRRCLLS